VRRRLAGLALSSAALFGAAPASADDLVLTLSSQEIRIAPNYQGGEITLFGAALDRDGEVAERGSYDLVVTARGPAETFAVREKAPTFGLWFNRGSRDFAHVPAFLSVLSNRPLNEIADPATRLRDRIGLAAALARGPASAGEEAKFAAALIRVQQRHGLWSEDPAGIGFVGAALFKGTVRLPPTVPFGEFEVEARLMRDGRTIDRETIAFRVVKHGFEARVAELAATSRLAYGGAAVALALLFGWLASVIFRRD
jgi:uncharacterized protein (TIGR02186 family)